MPDRETYKLSHYYLYHHIYTTLQILVWSPAERRVYYAVAPYFFPTVYALPSVHVHHITPDSCKTCPCNGKCYTTSYLAVCSADACEHTLLHKRKVKRAMLKETSGSPAKLFGGEANSPYHIVFGALYMNGTQTWTSFLTTSYSDKRIIEHNDVARLQNLSNGTVSYATIRLAQNVVNCVQSFP